MLRLEFKTNYNTHINIIIVIWNLSHVRYLDFYSVIDPNFSVELIYVIFVSVITKQLNETKNLI